MEERGVLALLLPVCFCSGKCRPAGCVSQELVFSHRADSDI